MDCIFCKIVQGEIPSYKVWENDNFLVFLNINPINDGHLLIVPKKHFEEVYDMDDDLNKEGFTIAKKLSSPLRNSTGCKKVRLLVEGFKVPHAHIHLIPAFKEDELRNHTEKQSTNEELLQIQSKLSEAFKDIK